MTNHDLDSRMTAYVLAELDAKAAQQFDAEIANDAAAMAELQEIGSVVKLLERDLSRPTGLELSAAQRLNVERALELRAVLLAASAPMAPHWRGRAVAVVAGVCSVGLIVFLMVKPRHEYASNEGLEQVAFAPPPETEEVAEEETLPPIVEKAPQALVPSENRERYGHFDENPFVPVADDPRSTFSIDVDTASYALVRRFLRAGTLPPRDAVRIEELVNYFRYAYPEPARDLPVGLTAEVREAPWAPEHRLLRIGLKGRHVGQAQRPASNLVFLIDVSGSMETDNKLPLLKAALVQLVGELDGRDQISIVVYAGASGLVLPPTSGSSKSEILSALDRLHAGGSTNGGAGIELAYEMATRNFVDGGVNRVILATDGDFNVGVTNQRALVDLIQNRAATGVFLSVLGFGDGNYQDATLEQLADKGNGNYAYIDGLNEARKVLVDQLTGTLVTVAKDVKIQLEFNPAEVSAYRLIGYENRALEHRDFNDDRKDAGEIGADHTVTAFYELVPRAGRTSRAATDALKYQQRAEPRRETGGFPGELLTVKLRYKAPDAGTSQAIELAVRDSGLDLDRASDDFRFGAAVAGFGMLLRQSEHRGSATYGQLLDIARSSRGNGRDREARDEFIDLVRTARTIARAE